VVEQSAITAFCARIAETAAAAAFSAGMTAIATTAKSAKTSESAATGFVSMDVVALVVNPAVLNTQRQESKQKR
jgi:hypothetical protein